MLPHKPAASPRFPPDAVRFLRSLKRHNDREWFRTRRDLFDRVLRGPMVAVIERLAIDLPHFLPELIASPRVSMYRIYRDTRFSADKTPLKTHVAAVFPFRGLPRHQGPGLYFEVASGWVYAGGGIYMPEPQELQRIREHLAENHARFRRAVSSRAFRHMFGDVEGEKLTRVPRGYAADHPAADLLKYKQFLAGREWPPTFASSPRFYPELLDTFRTLAPMIRLLSEPLLERSRDPLFG
jgi:uncharacterized protein (TIGR02453 family)